MGNNAISVYRYPKNRDRPFASLYCFIMFQFLIGILKTTSLLEQSKDFLKFQFLIGILKTNFYQDLEEHRNSFNSL